MGLPITPTALPTVAPTTSSPSADMGQDSGPVANGAASSFAALLAQLGNGVVAQDIAPVAVNTKNGTESNQGHPLLTNEADLSTLFQTQGLMPINTLPTTPAKDLLATETQPLASNDEEIESSDLLAELLAPALDPAQQGQQIAQQNLIPVANQTPQAKLDEYTTSSPLAAGIQPDIQGNDRHEAQRAQTPPALIATTENLPAKSDTAILAAETSPPAPNTFASALHAQTALQANRGEVRETPNPHVGTPLHHGNWGHDFSEKITWLAKNDLQSAQISINPPQLGPIQITLSLAGDQASASFAAIQPEVRQAIESSLPQLREMLAASGIQLGDANVGAHLPQQQRDAQGQSPNGQRLSGEGAILPANGEGERLGTPMPVNRGRGLVDLFA